MVILDDAVDDPYDIFQAYLLDFTTSFLVKYIVAFIFPLDSDFSFVMHPVHIKCEQAVGL